MHDMVFMYAKAYTPAQMRVFVLVNYITADEFKTLTGQDYTETTATSAAPDSAAPAAS
jgi:hypothetical protein